MIDIEKAVDEAITKQKSISDSVIALLAIAEQLQEQNIQLKRIADVQESKLAILRAKGE